VKFRLEALHVPSQETLTYGPWDGDPDPNKAAIQVAFAQGFVCGFHSFQTEGNGAPQDLNFKVVAIPSDEPEPETKLEAVFEIHDADMTVTHPDGSTD
jgi:hypothetical protein